MKRNTFLTNMLAILFVILFSTVSVHAQEKIFSVKGVVTDAKTGEPLIGVSILEKGTTKGTITDVDGGYTIDATAKTKLVFFYVGYGKKEVIVANRTQVDVLLVEEDHLLDEIVVVGYGVQKKSVVTAAISRVTGDDLNIAKPSRVEDALKGKVSGVQITQSSGQPGADSKVRIRGIGTVNNSDPLYIIDGMPVDGGINFLNPVDIQSIEILKDAASAAIYGARAANGVVLVTTKSGKEGKTTINYDFSYGWQNPWKKRSVLNAKEYMVIMNEAQLNDGNAPRYSAEQISSAGPGTDWQDKTFNFDAPVQSHQVSVSGGNQKGNYFLSAGYYNQEGIVGGDYNKSNYERLSLRSNSTYTLFEANDRKYFKKLSVGVNMGYSRSISRGIETNSEYGSILGSAVAFSPLVSIYADESTAEGILKDHPNAVKDKHGRVFSLPPSGFQEIANPLAMLNRPYDERWNDDKFVSNFWAELQILPMLKFKSSYGTDLAFWGMDGHYFPYYLASQNQFLDESYVTGQMHRGFKWQVENVFTYNQVYNEKHNLSLVLGQSAQKYKYRYLSGTDYNLLELDPSKANINSAIADRDKERVDGGTGGYNFTALASYFGRVDYNFDERYMAQFTIRRDGSSKFGPNHKWATFPAVSLGWNILNEPYLNRPEWFDSFKLRFSWGKNGNENIGNFRYASLMSGGQNYYYGGGYNVATDGKDGTMQYGTSPSNIANPNIKWEESVQTDLGFDARFLEGKLGIGFDYFIKKTKGMLMDQPIPSYVGLGAPLANVGDMKNSGIEFEITWKSSVKDFNYGITANASYLKNELIKLGNATGEAVYESNSTSGLGSFIKGKNGEVWPYFYGYKTAGIFQNWEDINSYVNTDGKLLQPTAQPGDVRFVDYNEDGVIDDNDKTKVGKGMPDWTFGISFNAEWRGIDFSLFLQGATGNDIFDLSTRGDIPAMNRPAEYLNRWHGEGTSNSLPRMTNSNPNSNWRSSDLFIKNGSYLRVKTVQLGYTLPLIWTKKAFIERLRVYVSAENLLTFTAYDGFDPEIATGDYNRIGVDRGIYPQARTISIGVNVSF